MCVASSATTIENALVALAYPGDVAPHDAAESAVGNQVRSIYGAEAKGLRV